MIRALVVLILLALIVPAMGRDDGRWAQSDPKIKRWIERLTDRNGAPCCDTADGHEVEGWAFGAEGYRVKVQGEWLDVPATALLAIPNRLGFARVWLFWENGRPKIRCFLPGAGG